MLKSPDGWHGFDFSDAWPMPEDDKQRLLEITAGLRASDLRGDVFVARDDVFVDNGQATFSTSGDTLIFRHRTQDGYENIYDCKVRALWHRRMDGCGPNDE